MAKIASAYRFRDGRFYGNLHNPRIEIRGYYTGILLNPGQSPELEFYHKLPGLKSWAVLFTFPFPTFYSKNLLLKSNNYPIYEKSPYPSFH